MEQEWAPRGARVGLAWSKSRPRVGQEWASRGARVGPAGGARVGPAWAKSGARVEQEWVCHGGRWTHTFFSQGHLALKGVEGAQLFSRMQIFAVLRSRARPRGVLLWQNDVCSEERVLHSVWSVLQSCMKLEGSRVLEKTLRRDEVGFSEERVVGPSWVEICYTISMTFCRPATTL